MSHAAVTVAVPVDAAIASFYPGSDFRDSYLIAIGNDRRSALAIYLDIVSRTPKWIDVMMTARNRAVSLLGLKNLGALGSVDRSKAEDAYCAGDRIGIFCLQQNTFDEIILGDADRHLDVKVSVRRAVVNDTTLLQVTTVVHIHNALGRVYMSVVAPAHRRIVPKMLARYVTTP
jgi:hypothetical protein